VNHFQGKDALVATIKEDAAVLLNSLVVKEKETVMVQVMEGLMMDMMDVREILSVVAIIASSLGVFIMRKTTAARNPQTLQLTNLPQLSFLELPCHHLKARDALDETSKGEDAAHLRPLVMRVKVIVMVQEMVELMMAILDARGTWCVAATIANSLVHTTTRKMIAAKNHKLMKDGVPGSLGASVPDHAVLEGRRETDSARDQIVATFRNQRKGFVIQIHAQVRGPRLPMHSFVFYLTYVEIYNSPFHVKI